MHAQGRPFTGHGPVRWLAQPRRTSASVRTASQRHFGRVKRGVSAAQIVPAQPRNRGVSAAQIAAYQPRETPPETTSAITAALFVSSLRTRPAGTTMSVPAML